MHGPPGGRRPVDETTHPQRPGEWFRSGRWLAGACGGAIVFPAVVLHELGHFGAFAAFGFPDPVLRSPLPAGPVSGRSADSYGPGQVCLAASGEPVNPDAKGLPRNKCCTFQGNDLTLGVWTSKLSERSMKPWLRC